MRRPPWKLSEGWVWRSTPYVVLACCFVLWVSLLFLPGADWATVVVRLVAPFVIGMSIVFSTGALRERRQWQRNEAQLAAIHGQLPKTMHPQVQEDGSVHILVERQNGELASVVCPPGYSPMQDGARLILESLIPDIPDGIRVQMQQMIVEQMDEGDE